MFIGGMAGLPQPAAAYMLPIGFGLGMVTLPLLALTMVAFK